MNSAEDKQPEATHQPAYRNPAEPYLQQSASPQVAYCPSLYSAPQDAFSEKHARSLLRGAGNTASLIPILATILSLVITFVFMIVWIIANIGTLLPLLKQAGGREKFMNYYTSQTGTFIFLGILATIVAMVLAIIIARSMLHCKIKEQYKRPSLTIPEFVKYLVVVLGIAGASTFINIGIEALTSQAGIKITSPDFSLTGNAAENAVMLLYVCLLGPILEETLFRGLILQGLRSWGDKLAIIVSGVLFGLMHMNLVQGIFAAMLGMFFAFVAVKSGSIIPTIILHILNNSISMIFEICGLETNQALQIGYMVFLGVMLLAGIVLFLLKQIPFQSVSKQPAPNIPEPEHPYRVVFLQSGAFWVMVALFVVNSFLPAISSLIIHR